MIDMLFIFFAVGLLRNIFGFFVFVVKKTKLSTLPFRNVRSSGKFLADFGMDCPSV